ncbi:MAG TPA: hypothetical protein VMH41_17000 [Mycobacteriales bacterium]|nr:hypothetical protein [Mycobacteriales bacterium]
MTLPAPTMTCRANFVRKKAWEDLVVSFLPSGGYWRFNEAAGTIAFDRLNGNHGTYAGGFSLGQTGLLFEDTSTDVKFNGSTGYMSVPDANSLDAGDTFTVGGVVKLAATGSKQYLCCKGTGAFGIYVGTDNKIHLEKFGTADIVSSTATLDTSAHFWMVAKSGSSIFIYIDDTDVTGSISNQTCTSTATALYVGQNSAGSSFSSATFGELFYDTTQWSSVRASQLYVAFAMGEFGAPMDSFASVRIENGQRTRGMNFDRSNTQVGELDLTLTNTDKFWTQNRNLAPNPSMEFGLHDLNLTAIASIGAAGTSLAWKKDPASGGGTYSGQVSLSGTINSMVWFPIECTVASGQSITIAAKLKSISGNAHVEVGIASMGTPSDLASSGGTISGSYGTPTATLTVTADRKDLVCFIRTTSAASAVVGFDEFQVNAGSSANAYIEAPTWPMLQDALPFHLFATYSATDYALFHGYAQRATPTPDDQRVALVIYDALANLNQPVDVTITGGGTHYSLRYALLDAAIRRVQQTAGGAENLCINGSAETDTSGWLTSASWSRSTSAPYSGTASFKLAGPQGAAYMMPPFLQAQMVVGRPYQLSFRARIVSAADSLTAQFGDIFLQPAGYGQIVTGSGSAAALTTTYQRYSMLWFNTGSQNAGSIQFLSTSGDPANGIYIDEVMISEGYVLPPAYVDFATPTGRLRNYAAPGQSIEAVPIFSQGWGNRCTNPEGVSATTGWTTLAGPYFGNNAASPSYLGSGWSDTDTQSYTVPSTIYSNNVLYILDVENSHATSANTVTVSGGGLTWTSHATGQFSGTTRRLTRFRALVTSGASTGALTITVAGSANTGLGYILKAYAGVPTGGTAGSAAVGTAVMTTGTGITPAATAGSAASPAHMMDAVVCADVGVTITAVAPYAAMNRISGLAPAGSMQTQWADFPVLATSALLSASAHWAVITTEIKGKSGGTLNRISNGYNPAQGGTQTRLSNNFGTGFTLASGAYGNSAIFTITGTFRAGHTYTGSMWASQIDGYLASTYKVALASPAGGDVAFSVVTGPVGNPGQRLTITFVPVADRTDVSFVVRASASNSAVVGSYPGQITFSGVMVNPGALLAYARTGITSPQTLDEVNTIVSSTTGISSHSHCTQFTTYATAGSGVHLVSFMQPVNAKTITMLVTATASTGTPSIAFGIANPWGVASVDGTSATYTLSTTPQRFYVKFTPARTDFTTYTGQLAGSNLVLFAMVTSASAVTISLDDVSLTIGTIVQPYIPPEISGVDTNETDLLPPYSTSSGSTSDVGPSAIDTLNTLNQDNLGAHYIAYLRNRPYYKYTSVARKTLVTKGVTQTWSETFAAVTNLQNDRDVTYQVAVAQYNPNSITPGTGVVVPLKVGVMAQASSTILSRTAGAPREVDVGATDVTNGPAGSCTDAQDLCNYQIARYGSSKLRPQITRTNDWSVILASNPMDVVAWTFARQAISGLPLLLLSQQDTIGKGAARWDSQYDTEEFVRA